MMIAPQDRGKVAGLIAAVVVVFAFVVWRTMSMMAPKPATDSAPTAPISETTSNAPNPATPPTATGAPPADPGVVAISVPANAAELDPFRDVLGSSTTAPIQTKPRPQPPRPILGTLPPFKPGPIRDLPADEPKLTGIMTGSEPLAVVVVAGKEEILHVGESTSNGYRLVSITSQKAVLAKKSVRLNLSVSP